MQIIRNFFKCVALMWELVRHEDRLLIIEQEVIAWRPEPARQIRAVSDAIDREDFPEARILLNKLGELIGINHIEIVHLSTMIAMLED